MIATASAAPPTRPRLRRIQLRCCVRLFISPLLILLTESSVLAVLALSIALIAVLGAWRRDRRLLSESRKGLPDREADRTAALEEANQDLEASQADLQRRWQYLAEAQRLSHSGTFGWNVRSGELVWSDET
jgi:hypothetical protein